MKKFKLTEQQKDKIRYLAAKIHEKKHLALYIRIANQIGINNLEKAIGLTLEDPKVRNKGAYIVTICKTYGYKPGR